MAKEFTLTAAERLDCYLAINFGDGKSGFTVSEQLLDLGTILDAITEGATRDEKSGNIDFESCDKDKIIKLRKYHVDKIITALKKCPWKTAEKAIKIQTMIKKLEDAENKKEDRKGD